MDADNISTLIAIAATRQDLDDILLAIEQLHAVDEAQADNLLDELATRRAELQIANKWTALPAAEQTNETAVAALGASVGAQACASSPTSSKARAVKAFDCTLTSARFPHTHERKNKDGEVVSVRLLSTIENLEHMFDEYGIPCAYNEMSKNVDVEVPGRTFSRDNKKCVALSEIKSASHRNGLPVTETKEYMLAIADKHAFHPVRDFVLSKPWDKVSRLQELFDTLVVDYTMLEMRDMLVKRWLLNAVAAVFSQNHSDMFYGVLTLQGPGDAGKTRWFQALVPPEIDGFKEGVTLKPDDKDSVLQANSNWIVELGELDKTTSKTAAGEIKAYLTHTHDELRRAYAADAAKYKRRTVYCATVNPARFLVDDTGNRRFWTLAVKAVTVDHGIDIQQLWAEVYELYLGGEQWWLTKSEVAMLNESNKEFEVADPMDELLREHFDFSAEVGSSQARVDGGSDETAVAGTVVVNATSISVALGLGFEGNKQKINPLSAALARLTGKKATSIKVAGSAKVVTGWRLKAYNARSFMSLPSKF